MKLEARIFLWIALFCFVVSGVYAWWAWHDLGQVEWAGLAGLILSGGLLGLGGSFFWFVSRRIDARPEDRNDADIAEGAGELGFFSPGSYWPFGIALSALVTGFGMALAQFWLMGLGVVLILSTAGGLLFEYYVGNRAPLR
ncbi:cytochrome c oxidase subunit 4 [Jatrophihabitans telluris]|uniref:Cytochrome c oxidase polypeptide 4 n=1 Tax=Jatrophihabitans telluris TaxID=2038343 RepID=A0ABY4QVC0_9ACTN|nr:cytochrome c oxidase subunit 4 [Jatrophihabitans telluris]UQX87253.1 cytochrome c oxidase subunit 4 [Jatrophihabitans telluris]